MFGCQQIVQRPVRPKCWVNFEVYAIDAVCRIGISATLDVEFRHCSKPNSAETLWRKHLGIVFGFGEKQTGMGYKAHGKVTYTALPQRRPLSKVAHFHMDAADVHGSACPVGTH